MRWSTEVRAALDKLLQSDALTKIAVFDADGTLWHDDIGESFFKYQVQNHLAPGVHGIKDPWLYYRNMCAKDHVLAYAWLAQINAGTAESLLRQQSKDYYRRHFRSKICPDMRELITNLTAKDFEVWVVSASHRWSLEPAVEELKIPQERLIAVEVTVDAVGKLTKEVVTPIPYKSGKKYWIEKKLSAPPLFVAGNSMGDLEMLESARNFPLATVYLPHLPEIKESEEALLAEAAKRGWLKQIFQ